MKMMYWNLRERGSMLCLWEQGWGLMVVLTMILILFDRERVLSHVKSDPHREYAYLERISLTCLPVLHSANALLIESWHKYVLSQQIPPVPSQARFQ